MHTLSEVWKITARPLTDQVWRACALGFAAQTLESDRSRLGASLQTHLDRLMPAIEARQCEFYFDELGRFAGYVIWKVGEETNEPSLESHRCTAVRSRLTPDPRTLWISELWAPFGDLPAILHQLCQHHVLQYATLAYRRQRRGQFKVRIFDRDRLTNFHRKLRHSVPAAGLTNLRSAVRDLAVDLLTQARDLGNALLILRRAAKRESTPLTQILDSLRCPILLRQYHLYISAEGEPEGLITWAWLTSTAGHSTVLRPLDQLHISEWNEGNCLCLCDWQFSVNCVDSVRMHLSENWFPAEPFVLTYPSFTDHTQPGWRFVHRPALASWLTGQAIPANRH